MIGARRRPRVPRSWPGLSVVVAASGPSLAAADLAAVRGRRPLIVVNDAYQLAPWADVLYACDQKWWAWHRGAPACSGLRYALDPGAAAYGATVLQNTGKTGLERSPDGLRTGYNSGYQAINLAVHLGAARIVLLGFDMQPSPAGLDHYFGQHPDHSAPPYLACRRAFATLPAPLAAAGVVVLNASRATALDVFPRIALADELTRPAVVWRTTDGAREVTHG